MSEILKYVIITIVFLFLILILKSVKRRKLNINFSIFWILISIVLIVSIAMPNMVEFFSRLLGFEKASNMIFFLTIFIIFYIILVLMVYISKEIQKNISLVQEISILKNRIQELEKKIK